MVTAFSIGAGLVSAVVAWVLCSLLIALGMTYESNKKESVMIHAVLLSFFMAAVAGVLVAFAIGGLK